MQSLSARPDGMRHECLPGDRPASRVYCLGTTAKIAIRGRKVKRRFTFRPQTLIMAARRASQPGRASGASAS